MELNKIQEVRMDENEKDRKLKVLENQLILAENHQKGPLEIFANIFPIKNMIGDIGLGTSSGKQERGRIIHSGDKPRIHKKIGRNDLCPCDSGQKFKKCHSR